MMNGLLQALMDQVAGTHQRTWNKNMDRRGEIPPLEGDQAGKNLKPDNMMRDMRDARDPKNIYNDAGDIVDYEKGGTPGFKGGFDNFLKDIIKNRPGKQGDASAPSSNPFSKLIDTPREGALANIFRSLTNPSTPVTPSGDTLMSPGTPTPQDLSKTPEADQRQPGFAQTPPPPPPVPLPTPRPDYSQPTALDPQSIEELRKSLLTDAGQLDPNNPNGLSGRMNSPYSAVDQTQQMNDAQGMSDQLNSERLSANADRNNH